MSPQEALARIAALEVHDPDDRGGDTYDADEVRAILAEVTPETGCTLTPEEAAMVVQLYRIITLGVGSNAMLPGTAELAARLETFR